ncbi:MAG: response regulator transcription factor [Cyanobacteria bacterium J06648_16]
MVQVFLVDLQALSASTQASYLDAEADIALVGSAHTGADAIASLHRLKLARQIPHLLLIVTASAIQPALALVQCIRYQWKDLSILLVAELEDKVALSKLIRLGINGCISYRSGQRDLVNAVRIVSQGYSYMDNVVIQHVFPLLNQTPLATDQPTDISKSTQENLAKLSPREREVLCLLASGQSNNEIAQTLYIAEKTVKNHITRIFKKLKITNRTQAALLVRTSPG